MKKVLLSLLSVVALSAATGIEDQGVRCPGAPLKGFTQCLNYNTGQFEFRARPVEEDTRGTITCPPTPTRNHPTAYFNYQINQWIRVPASKQK